VCLDYISILQTLDIDLQMEGDKIKVENETLTPNFLESPRDMYSQVFNFANDAIADNPRPILTVIDKISLEEDPAWDGMEIIYDVGQVKLGAPLQAKDNYDLMARSYFFYTKGLYAEDILEQILLQVDGYGGYLFGETSAQAVIDNHLIEDYFNVEGKPNDVLTPNYTASDVTVYSKLTVDYSPESGGDPTTLYLDDVSGFTTSGTSSVNGDMFSWTGKGVGCLTGLPLIGAYALGAHKAGSYAKFEISYPLGQVWYLTYSNLQTDLDASDFTIPTGTMRYFDKRFGRIILEAPITTGAYVTCNSNYTFKTLQATGIELNKISFRPRELQNRFEAITKLRNYLAPNYGIRTVGDNKIWASYLTQRVIEDYELTLVKKIDFLEDEDLYTRVVWYGKNKNPTNIMFNELCSFLTTGNDYRGIANEIGLEYLKTEGGYHWYKTPITDAGYISAQTLRPKVWINNVLVDNALHYLEMVPVKWQVTTKTTTTSTTTQTSGGGKCFVAGTQVRMSDGTTKDIETIETGDIVKSWNTKDGKIENKQVLTVDNGKADKLLGIEFDIPGKGITYCTFNHPIFVAYKGWSSYDPEATFEEYGFEVRKIAIDDTVFFYGEEKLVEHKIKNLVEVDMPEKAVYTLTFVEDNNNFFANDILVHNGGGDEGTSSSTTTTTYTEYTYRIYFAHQNLEPNKPITIWNAFADQSQIIPANDGNMDYGRGIYYVPGSSQNSTVEQASMASYYVFYGDDAVVIDYDTVIFKIKQSMIDNPNTAAIKATFMYWTSMTSVRDIKNVIDGRWNTQVQTEFFAEPPTGYNYAILDLGAIYSIQALDIIAGFYRPDDTRRFDIEFRFSLQYSLDNVDYYDIGDTCSNVEMTGGKSASFEEDDLGLDFKTRYLKLVLEDVKNIPYKTEQGVYVVAFTEIAAYGNIVLKGEAKLVPTTELTADIGSGDTTVYVTSTKNFTEPESAEEHTAVINGLTFSYTGLTAFSFTGCTVGSGVSGLIGDKVYAHVKNDDTEINDDTLLLPHLGDRMYKNVNVSDDTLYTQVQVDYQAISILREFIKNHTKLSVDVVYAPYLQVGQTVRLIDPFTGTDRRYFVEKVADTNGAYSLTLAYYPA